MHLVLTTFRPTVLSTIFSAAFDIPQTLFFNIWNDISDAGQLNGHIIGSKNSIKAVFVPQMHDRLVREYVKSTFLSNEFIQASVLKKLSVVNPQSYFKEILPKEKLDDCVFLQSGVAHRDIWTQTQRSIEERIQTELFCSIEQQLPSTLSDLSDADIESLVSLLKKSHPSWSAVTSEEHIIYEPKLIENTLHNLEPWLHEKVKTDAPSVVDRLKNLQTQQPKKTIEASKKTLADDNVRTTVLKQ